MTRNSTEPEQGAIGVFGVSGVGKTTLISQLVGADSSFVHVQASTLIKESFADPTITSEQLSLSLAISCRVTSHINQDVERGRADFCGIDPLPRPLQIALGP